MAGILSIATEPPKGDVLDAPFQATNNLTLGAVNESSDEAAEADKLAKQLTNPIASLIRVPFPANEDWRRKNRLRKVTFS